MKHILLSYPRSGNHLVRFFIELLSGNPTFGCKGGVGEVNIYKNNVSIHKNKFDKTIPFDIQDYDVGDCYHKYHFAHDITPKDTGNLILIVRNPNEVLLRHCRNKLDYKSFQLYFDDIDFYNRSEGKKLLLYYEDILTNKVEFVNALYNFLNLQNKDKKEYVLDNLEALFVSSSKGRNRCWGGYNSEGKIDYYYHKIPANIKKAFDNYVSEKVRDYPFIKKKYSL